jgi:hypothetical protein
MAKLRTLGVERIEKVLVEARGCVSAAAQALGVDKSTLYRHIRASKRLQTALENGRAMLVGDAHSGLVEAVRARKPWAIMFTLRYLGKDEGFVERMEMELAHPQAEYDW